MLSDINKAYLALVPGFEKHPLRENLMAQLQRWVSVAAVMAVNGKMGFSSEIQIPEFQLDTDGLRDKKSFFTELGKPAGTISASLRRWDMMWSCGWTATVRR